MACQRLYIARSASFSVMDGTSPRRRSLTARPAPPAKGSAYGWPSMPFDSMIALMVGYSLDFPPG